MSQDLWRFFLFKNLKNKRIYHQRGTGNYWLIRQALNFYIEGLG